MLDRLNLPAILACADEQWSPQIGDPTFAGWLTVSAYAACAILGVFAFRRTTDRREQVFWALLALIVLFLCINKQLDLQSLLTAIGRCVSQLQGWYEERREFQRRFIVGTLVVAALFVSFVLWLMRKRLTRNGVAIAGLAVVMAFVAVRAVGFHHFDAFIGSRAFDIRFNVLFELSGLILIAANATFLSWFARHPKGKDAKPLERA